MRDMIPGDLRVPFGDLPPPFFPRQESQARLTPEPCCHPLRISSQSKGSGGNDVKTLAHCRCTHGDSSHKGLRNVAGVDVMYGLHSKVGKQEFTPTCKQRENLRIDVAGRIDRSPSRPDDMPRVQNGGGKASGARLFQQVGLDGRFLAAVVAKGLARLLFAGRNLHAWTVDPDGTAMQEVLHAAAQCVHQLRRTRRSEASEIDYDFGRKLRDAVPESTARLRIHAVQQNGLDALPRLVRLIGISATATHAHDGVTGFHQLWCEVCSNVSCATYDCNTHEPNILPPLEKLH